MPFALKLAIQGRIGPYMEATRRAGRKAVTTVVRRKVPQMERRMKAHVASKLGTPLSKSARSAAYPRTGESFGAAGEVYFLASRKTDAGNIDIIELFTEGARVVPRSSRFLWVPTDEGRRLGGAPKNKPRSLTPQTFRGGQLQFIPSRNRRARAAGRLVLRNNPRITVFIALRRVTIRKKLRLDRIYDSVLKNYVQLVNQAWDRNLTTEVNRLSRGR